MVHEQEYFLAHVDQTNDVIGPCALHRPLIRCPSSAPPFCVLAAVRVRRACLHQRVVRPGQSFHAPATIAALHHDPPPWAN